MMARVSDVVGHWLGLCRKPPMLRTAPLVLIDQSETTCPVQPDGGAGGSGMVRRGSGVALSGAKTLIRNRQLFWFPLFTGVVMAFMFIVQYMLQLLSVYPYDMINFPRWLVLTFVAELFTVFCLTVLLAGLVLSLAPRDGSPVSFRDGLSCTKNYLRPLADWSVTVALLGTAILVPVRDFVFSQLYMMLFSVYSVFPFNFVLLPEVYHIGPMAGTYAMEYGVTYTLILSAINLLLFALTLFVVPLLVLENKPLPEAVRGSFALMKNVGGEAASCILVLATVLFAVSLTSLLFPVIYGIVAPRMLLFWYPGEGWIAAGVLYMLDLCGLAVVISTVAGIAAVNLCRYGKTGRMPGSSHETPQNTSPE